MKSIAEKESSVLFTDLATPFVIFGYNTIDLNVPRKHIHLVCLYARSAIAGGPFRAWQAFLLTMCVELVLRDLVVAFWALDSVISS